MSSVAEIQLADIDISRLKLIKETYLWLDGQDHSRWVFQARGTTGLKEKGLVYKIWNPTYIRRDHFLQGIACGFYDETTVPALLAVIFERGVCRGYVMRKCHPVRRTDPVLHARILEKTAGTGYFCVQYSRYHTLLDGDKFTLVDLEAIHPVAELPWIYSRYRSVFDDLDYQRFVVDQYCQTFPKTNAARLMESIPAPASGTGRKFSPYRKFRSLTQTLFRHLSIQWGTIFNHIGRIDT